MVIEYLWNPMYEINCFTLITVLSLTKQILQQIKINGDRIHANIHAKAI